MRILPAQLNQRHPIYQHYLFLKDWEIGKRFHLLSVGISEI
jgi:hypothetical protein